MKTYALDPSKTFTSRDRTLLVLARCVLRDVPEAMTVTMARALLQAGELPAEIQKKFPDLGDNKGPHRNHED